jgi:hypothetical protein
MASSILRPRQKTFGNGLCVGEDDDLAPELVGTGHITGQPTWVSLESEAGSWGLVWRLAGDPFLENEAARVPFVLQILTISSDGTSVVWIQFAGIEISTSLSGRANKATHFGSGKDGKKIKRIKASTPATTSRPRRPRCFAFSIPQSPIMWCTWALGPHIPWRRSSYAT